ncbi:MAG: SRPBCC family protein [Flavobacteriales bacterium]|nr:SRPBCC family protein [Flavobacteriales bacterium]
MRVLKTILIILLAVVAIICILGMIGPDTYRYERSATIAAPAESVYAHVSSLGAMDKWSPWNELDPNMKKTMEGTDGTVGATQSWEGNSDVGKGTQRIDSLAPNSFVRTRLMFKEPMESEGDALVELTPAGDSTKVTWAMVGENNFMSKVMCKFMDMDAMIGKDFEKGLGMLKAQVETAEAARKADLAAKTSGGYLIETVDRPELVYIGKRNRKVKWVDIGTFFGTNFPAAGAAIGAAKLEMTGAPTGLYWEWNEKDQTADMAAAMPVKGDANTKVADWETFVVPASKMLMTKYYGDYAKSMVAHEAMNGYIKEKGLTHYGNVIEEYVTDPMTEKDTTKWLTNIYYMVK